MRGYPKTSKKVSRHRQEENQPQKSGQIWRRGKHKKVEPLEKRRYSRGGLVGPKCPWDCPYITTDGRCRLRTDPILHWQERKRCCFYEWWVNEKVGDARAGPLRK